MANFCFEEAEQTLKKLKTGPAGLSGRDVEERLNLRQKRA